MSTNDNSSPASGNKRFVDDVIKAIYLRLKDLDAAHPRFSQEVMLIQEEILKVEASESLTGDQKKALQLEISCIEDYIALMSINQDIDKTPSPSKKLLMQQKYALADIASCMQSLRSAIFL